MRPIGISDLPSALWTLLTGALTAAAIVVLAACASTPAADLFALRSSYDAAFLVPASHYAGLPRCPTADSVCSDAKVVAALQKADAAALATLDAAETVARNNPQLDASTAIQAASVAVAAAIKIVQVYGVK